jgi:hypothetical protein
MNCCLIRARNELALRAGRIPPDAMSVLHHLGLTGGAADSGDWVRQQEGHGR